jgi:undecaprenyl-diphosphatase
MEQVYMMDILNSITLGIVQGITEFLPISSSGHLIIAREVLGIQVSYGLAYDAILQLATTLAVLIYFWKDIKKYTTTFLRIVTKKSVESSDKVMLFAIIIGTIPSVILGFLLEDSMESVFRNTQLVALMLIAGSFIMLLAEKMSKRYKQHHNKLTIKRGFIIGLYQALALIPGMSRSGMTISGGLFNGLNREYSARFSFLLAFPILLGSGFKKLFDLSSEQILSTISLDLFVGFLTSFVVGFCVIGFLLKFLRNNSMKVFIVYRIILAVVILIFL